ncbi:TPA: phosphorylcholine transferase LicD, partial [Haemophilus influenzae]
EHLTQYYGDYMQLPPEEDQKPHHIQEAYIL